MKSFLMGLLSNSDSTSTMRLMSIASLLVGAVIGVYGVYKGTDLSGVAELCAVFVVSAFGGKVAQKHLENK